RGAQLPARNTGDGDTLSAEKIRDERGDLWHGRLLDQIQSQRRLHNSDSEHARKPTMQKSEKPKNRPEGRPQQKRKCVEMNARRARRKSGRRKRRRARCIEPLRVSQAARRK